ncbi:hypothetical protein ACFYW9_19110 [Streptomyces sp. NPDC002698]|uniref:hypothetical protein n=1 Tax=Streptomyces sp. NPDC002698 TaxID=3364660 RepID=UPI003678FFD8
MQICTRSLANVRPHMRRKALAVLLEHFRLNRQDFRKGWNFVFTAGRRRPQVRTLPIVAKPEPVMSGYGSRYPDPKWGFGNSTVTSIPLDLV